MIEIAVRVAVMVRLWVDFFVRVCPRLLDSMLTLWQAIKDVAVPSRGCGQRG